MSTASQAWKMTQVATQAERDRLLETREDVADIHAQQQTQIKELTDMLTARMSSGPQVIQTSSQPATKPANYVLYIGFGLLAAMMLFRRKR